MSVTSTNLLDDLIKPTAFSTHLTITSSHPSNPSFKIPIRKTPDLVDST